ncbi:hypothetical protein HanXRQr2_Chr04g0166791 [Helianthus annuus]|uniref:Uncharacterized protein n=1 Tax=Helianthus annuus TaxID=4232 RepID=A0A9K3J8J9_HELAN|nr:hypothetical protein HanXRQr2_Chr04g0166791 [Helianthus annuus]
MLRYKASGNRRDNSKCFFRFHLEDKVNLSGVECYVPIKCTFEGHDLNLA